MMLNRYFQVPSLAGLLKLKKPRKQCRTRRNISRIRFETLESRLTFDAEPNDSFANAEAASDISVFYGETPLSTAGSVNKANDVQDFYYFFGLFGNSSIHITLNGLSSDADLFLYDKNRNQVASSTAAGIFSELITFDLSGPGPYYVEVRAFSNATNYSLNVYNDFSGSNLTDARDIGVSWGQNSDKYYAYDKLNQNDYMDFRDNVDTFKFRMEAAGTISVRRLATQDSGGGALQTNLELLDSLGSIITSTTHSSDALNIDRVSLPAGQFYVRLRQSAGVGNYQLRITSDYAGDSLATARNLSDITNSSRQYYDMVGDFNQPSYLDQLDLYRFSVSKAGPLDAAITIPSSQTPPTFDADLFLAQDTNSNGFIEDNEISLLSQNAGNDSLRVNSLLAGNYVIGVRQRGAFTSYKLDLDSDLDSPINLVAPTIVDMATAIGLGTLNGQKQVTGGLGISLLDFIDTYSFEMTSAGELLVNILANSEASALSRTSSALSVFIVRDSNNNLKEDSGEVIMRSNTGRLQLDLTPGKYFLRIFGTGQVSFQGSIQADYAGNSLLAAKSFAPIIGLNPADQVFRDYIEQDIGAGNDVDDFYTFNLPASFETRVSTSGVAGEDLSLELIRDLNKNGLIEPNEITATSDILNQPAESISRVLAAGRYFVRVHGVNGSTNYVLRLAFTPPLDPDDTIAEANRLQANTLSPGESLNSTLEYYKDVDLFKITVIAGRKMSFDIDSRGSSTVDTYLRIFNANGLQLAANNDGRAPGETASDFSYLEYLFETAGTYYVGVSLAPNMNYRILNGSGDIGGLRTGAYQLTANSLGTRNLPSQVLRVSAGSSTPFIDRSGNYFDADRGFTGGVKSSSPFAVVGTTDDELYFTNRRGASIDFVHSIANGTYILTLGFAESAAITRGQRQFDVFAENRKILENFDIVASAGATRKAITRSFTVNVVGGKLDLRFRGVVGDALISSISLVAV